MPVIVIRIIAKAYIEVNEPYSVPLFSFLKSYDNDY